MQDETLRLIARELSGRIKAKASLDWTQRETVRADMRRTIRRLLTKYGYPPDAQESATQLVIRQAELMAEGIRKFAEPQHTLLRYIAQQRASSLKGAAVRQRAIDRRGCQDIESRAYSAS